MFPPKKVKSVPQQQAMWTIKPSSSPFGPSQELLLSGLCQVKCGKGSLLKALGGERLTELLLGRRTCVHLTQVAEEMWNIQFFFQDNSGSKDNKYKNSS